MSSLAIPSSRLQQVEAVMKEYVSAFCQPIGSPAAIEKFVSIYHPSVEWFDHAFLICRIGHDAVIGLHRSWNHCNQPFRAEIKALYPTASGAVLEQIWHGRCANDIVRPDGEVAVKANGKTFVCHICTVIAIDEDGKITKIDEYYNKAWADGIPQQEYKVLRGAAMKEPTGSSSL